MTNKIKTISLNSILQKDYFNIKDLANITKRETNTIRAWEIKGIIEPADKRGDNNWRMYSRGCLAHNLERILTYNWQRTVIKNSDELKYVIAVLKGEQHNNSFVNINVQLPYDKVVCDMKITLT